MSRPTFKHWGKPGFNTACGAQKPTALMTVEPKDVTCPGCKRTLKAMGVLPRSAFRVPHSEAGPPDRVHVLFTCPDGQPHGFVVDGYIVDEYGVAVFQLRCQACSATVTATHPLGGKKK